VTPGLNAWSGLAGGAQYEFPRNDPTRPEIFAYCDRLSYRVGDSVRLQVHTNAASFDLTLACDSHSDTVLWSRAEVPGHAQKTPANAYAVGCGWHETLTIPIAAGWRSGLYLITLRTVNGGGVGATCEASFVVRPAAVAAPGRALLVLATGTWVAYNDWGGANAYRRVEGGRALDVPATHLSLERPWARGFLRLPSGAPRHGDVPDLPPHAEPRYPWLEWAMANGYSRHYVDAGWANYEKEFARWAGNNGYPLDFITQHDLPDCADQLQHYSALVIVGHDEYWSWEMRDALDAYLQGGGNLARFAGNFLWQVRMENAAKVQVCYKFPTDDPIHGTDQRNRTTTHWDAPVIGRPAATSIGLTGMNGLLVRFGGITPRAPGGYTVYRPDHWALKGTDLYYGDMFGQAPARILAYEVDGCDYTFRHGLPFPTHADATPDSLEILAMSPATRGEIQRHPGFMRNAPLEEMGEVIERVPPFYGIASDARERGAGMMAVCSFGKGEVFNGGCCNWVAGLIHRDYYVEAITRNVLDRFLAISAL
jgi:hypothetical protein